MSSSPTIIQIVASDETGDSLHRMRWPAEQLSHQKPDWRVLNVDFRHPQRFEWAIEADLLVLYQSADPDFLPVIQKRKRLGRKTLVEYNDNFYAAQEWSPVGQVWSSPLTWQIYERFIQEAEGLMVTGPGLQQLFSEKFPDQTIHTLPNHHPHPLKAFTELWPQEEEVLRVGWAGSLGHMADLISLCSVFRKLLKEGLPLEVHLMGNRSIPELCRIPKENLRFRNWSGMDEYFDFWKSVHVGVAPLLASEYNDCRSDAKAVEMSAMGVCPVLQSRKNYKDFISKARSLHFSNFEELPEILRRLSKDKTLAKKQALAAYQYIKEERQGLDRNERASLYESLLPNRFSKYEDWPKERGFHFIDWKEQPKLGPSFKTMEELRSLAKSKRFDDCEQVLKTALQEYPFHPELALFACQFIFKFRPHQFDEFFQSCLSRFPRDLRFHLAKLQLAADDQKQEIWNQILERLSEAPQKVREFYYPQLTEVLRQSNLHSDFMRELVSELIQIFGEDSEALEFIKAQQCEFEGKTKEAFQLYHQLSLRKGRWLKSKAFFESLSPGYLEAWSNALEARSQKSFPGD